MSSIAIIDIGSNSVRLVCYERDDQTKSFKILYNQKFVCGLGKGLRQTAKLSSKSKKLALQALQTFKTYLKDKPDHQLYIFATEALRSAKDGKKFIETIKKKTGFSVSVLEGTEEALFAAYGVVSAFPDINCIVGDLGGGSLELCNINDHQTTSPQSFPLGALRLQDYGDKAYDQAKAILSGKLEDYSAHDLFVCVGGSWRALAEAHQIWNGMQAPHSHGYNVNAHDLRAFLEIFEKQDEEKLLNTYGIDPSRIPLVYYASILLRCLIDELNIERIQFSNAGLRDGFLYATSNNIQIGSTL